MASVLSAVLLVLTTLSLNASYSHQPSSGTQNGGESSSNNIHINSEPEHILLVNPIRGSHFFFMLDIGRALSSAGYNVTLLSIDPESRVSIQTTPLFRVILPKDPSYLYNVRYNRRSESCVRILAEEYETTTHISNTIKVPACRETVLDMYQNPLRYFHSLEWEELQRENQFKLIVAEERSVWAATLATWSLNIPIVMANPDFNQIMPRVKHNLPLLFSSDPGTFNVWFEDYQGLFPKLSALWDAIQMAPFAIELESIFEPYLKRKNLTSLSDLSRQISLFFINDYPSFSFPFALPRSVVNIGTVGYSKQDVLPAYIKDFLRKDRKRTIYLSFGSYVLSDFNYLERYGVFIDAANSLNLKIIISLGSEKETFTNIFLSEEERQFSDRVLQLDHVLISNWLPQKQLLKSGEIALFVSHCGNNARIEAIYHTVPLLCIPFYAEQPLIANLIRYRGFGDLLVKEEISYSNVLRSLNSTLTRAPAFKENMESAVDVLKSAPYTVEQNMVYHVQLLLKYGKLDYLVNTITDRRTGIDLNNADVMLCAFAILLLCWEIGKRCCSWFLSYIRSLYPPNCG